MAFIELKANKLRTFLSLLGITIGIFCIVAVSTLLGSLEAKIRTNVASLGSDVIYISKWPWTDEGGEYKWWQYMNRPVLKVKDLKELEKKAQTLQYATLLYADNNMTAKHGGYAVEGVNGYAVTPNFERMQNFDLEEGRYFMPQELDGGLNMVVLGKDVTKELFPSGNPIGKSISLLGKKFTVIGVLKKAGDNIAGFNFDRGVILSYFSAAAVQDVNSPNANITLMAKAKPRFRSDDLSAETEGLLRGLHKIKPGDKNDFSINKLSQITEKLNSVFGAINVVGKIIAGFSLLVGGFGIANIMFVTVKERTKIIGLKKAIGAKQIAILIEFLMEAVALCIFGGIIGILFVFLLSLIITYGFDFKVTLSAGNIMSGIIISSVIGMLAGFIPAFIASRMNPVTAIRSN